MEKLENQSTRKAEQIFLAHASEPQKVKKERVRAVTDSLTEINMTFDQETIADFKRLKEIWAHLIPGANHFDLVKKMARYCRETCTYVDKQTGARRGAKYALQTENFGTICQRRRPFLKQSYFEMPCP